MLSAKKELFTPSGGGYQISRSVRLRSSASAYLNRTPASATNRKTWTWSGWVKRGTLGAINNGIFTAGTSFGTNNNNLQTITFAPSDVLTLTSEVGGVAQYNLVTTQVFRDPSAWYHIVVSIDTTQATSSNRIKLYINGTQVTAFSTASYPAQNYDGWINSANEHRIGSRVSADFDGYQTEINFIDGQALTPSSFGETNALTGVWQPKAYSGTYGTNGFELNFSNNSTAAALGTDFSGNSNTWTVNNISVTAGVTYDSMIDVPTLTSATAANYAVMSPISMAGSTATLSNGNLSFTNASTHARRASTIAVSSGKWYAEATITTVGGSYPIAGIATTSTFNGATYVGADSTSYGYSTNATKYNNASAVSYGATYTTNDVIGIALDLDAGTLVFYKNNVSQGTAYSGLSGEFTFAVSGLTGTVWELNFGQRPFTYTPPTGFVALNTQNLPNTTIKKGNTYFDVVTSTATVSTGTTVSSLAFSPGLMWRKNRNNVESHYWIDAVRGTGAGGFLVSNSTAAATGYPNSDGTLTFDSNGYTITETNWNVGEFYFNGRTYVDWIWDAGNTTVTNTSGSISAQVRANPTAGFSVVTYTGTGANATVGHGLGVAPRMIIVKERSAAGDSWYVYHVSLGATNNIFLDSTAASSASATAWNSTAPTSTVFSLGTSVGVNQSTQTYVAYCFSEVTGYSAFGSYTGNGSADGPFVFLGFRPRWVMIKSSSGVGTWNMVDSTRVAYNLDTALLTAQSTAAETQNAELDFLSNGFKYRGSSTNVAFDHNANGVTYIYAAFAENPFKHSLAR